MKTLIRIPALATLTTLSLSLAFSGCGPARASDGDWPGAPSVERGRYLVTTMACNDCHTPWHMGPNGPEPDASRDLSGHPAGLVMPPAPELPPGPWIVALSATNTAWAGPWGVSFTANLTPDEETGIGRWNEETFLATIRTGRHMGIGRALLPPMPAPAYAKLTDADLRSIYRYLRTIPAIHNRVPEPVAPAGASHGG